MLSSIASPTPLVTQPEKAKLELRVERVMVAGFVGHGHLELSPRRAREPQHECTRAALQASMVLA